MNSYLGRLLGVAPDSLTEPAEIEANRRGQITERQKQRLSPLGGSLRAVTSALRYIVLGLIAIYVLDWLGVESWMVSAAMAGLAVVGLGWLAVHGAGLVRRWAAVREDMSGSRLEEGTGHLVYGRGGYEAEVQGRRLTLAGRHNLAVGTYYHFFYLPTSGWVLSAEPRGAMAPAQATDSLTNSLATANGFSIGALPANREGRLSREQAVTFGPRLTMGGFTLLLGIGAAVLVFWPEAIFGGRGPLGPLEMLLRGSSLRMFFVAIPTAIGLYYIVTALVDLALGRVVAAEGDGQKVKVVSRRSGGTAAGGSRQTTYYYQIGGKRFKVKPEAWDALVEGVPYRAYYTRLSGMLVNLEPLASPAIA